jgi:hypothetical protein
MRFRPQRELITELSGQERRFVQSAVMGVARLSSADQAGLLGHKPHMIAIANAPRLRMAQDGFVDRGRWRRELSVMATQKIML